MDLPINYKEAHWTVRKQAREQYILEQNGLCAHCGTKLTENPSKEVQALSIDKKLFPAGMFDYPIHLHHDHNTNMTIGAIHAKCNAVLWQYYKE